MRTSFGVIQTVRPSASVRRGTPRGCPIPYPPTRQPTASPRRGTPCGCPNPYPQTRQPTESPRRGTPRECPNPYPQTRQPTESPRRGTPRECPSQYPPNAPTSRIPCRGTPCACPLQYAAPIRVTPCLRSSRKFSVFLRGPPWIKRSQMYIVNVPFQAHVSEPLTPLHKDPGRTVPKALQNRKHPHICGCDYAVCFPGVD